MGLTVLFMDDAEKNMKQPHTSYVNDFCHLGHHLIESDDYQDALTGKILHFTPNVGLLKG
jgi:hypothetical protein